MRHTIVQGLLGLYRWCVEHGLLEQPLARRAFERAYLAYKLVIEAGPFWRLRPSAVPGSIVVDVGANIGFFSLRFGRWVGAAGRVIAIEPEARNAATLRRRIARTGLCDVVDCVQAAAAEAPGELRLSLNPLHPGDHHIASAGEPVRAVTVDNLVDGDPRPVSLLKIDVQGAELRVLAGARATIARHRPAIFIEIDAVALRRLGSSVAELVGELVGLGYAGHRLTRRGIGPPRSPGELERDAAISHSDVLFLHAGGQPGRKAGDLPTKNST